MKLPMVSMCLLVMTMFLAAMGMVFGRIVSAEYAFSAMIFQLLGMTLAQTEREGVKVMGAIFALAALGLFLVGVVKFFRI